VRLAQKVLRGANRGHGFGCLGTEKSRIDDELDNDWKIKIVDLRRIDVVKEWKAQKERNILVMKSTQHVRLGFGSTGSTSAVKKVVRP